MKGPAARIAAMVVLSVFVLGLVVALAVSRMQREGADAAAACDDALRRGDRAAAVVFAARAARATSPRSPSAARGYAQLAAIARDAEAHGDRTAAAAAWRAMHGAAIATSSTTDGTGSDASRWLVASSEALARLSTLANAGSVPASGGPLAPGVAPMAAAGSVPGFGGAGGAAHGGRPSGGGETTGEGGRASDAESESREAAMARALARIDTPGPLGRVALGGGFLALLLATPILLASASARRRLVAAGVFACALVCLVLATRA
jgi:hypothetical protein